MEFWIQNIRLNAFLIELEFHLHHEYFPLGAVFEPPNETVALQGSDLTNIYEEPFLTGGIDHQSWQHSVSESASYCFLVKKASS